MGDVFIHRSNCSRSHQNHLHEAVLMKGYNIIEVSSIFGASDSITLLLNYMQVQVNVVSFIYPVYCV